MNRKISTFQIVLLAIFGALGVGSVLIFALATAGGGGGGVGAVTIWGTFNQTTVTDVLRAAAGQDSRLNDVSYVQESPDQATFESDLANALASGEGPDLFILRQDEVLSDQNKVYDIPYASLSQSQFDNTFVDGADTFLSQGGVVGVPILVDPLVLYWNRDELASAGIAQPPEYWDQVPQMVEQLTQKDDSGAITRSGIALGTYENIDAAKDILAMLIMQAGGTITTAPSQGQVNSALSQGGAASNAADSALAFYTEFANPSQSDYTWNNSLPDARQAFASGELAMYVGYASEEPEIEAMNPNLNFAASPVPQVRSSQNSIDEGVVYALAAPKAAPNLAGALTVAYLLASTQGDAALASALGIAPARRDALSAASSTEGDSVLFNQMALITRTWADPDPSQTDGIFQGMIENTESGALQGQDAVLQADQELDQLLGQQ